MPPQIAPRTTDALPPTPTTSDGSPDNPPTHDAAEPPDIVSGRRAVSTFLSLLSVLDTTYSKGKQRPPTSLLAAYTSALLAVPDSFTVASYYTGQASTITHTPYTSIVELTNKYNRYRSAQFVPSYPCGPNQSITGHAFAVATVPAMNSATSTFTIASNIESCFATNYIGSTYTLGPEAFTSSMRFSYMFGPCPAYYTMDVAYPASDDPSLYTTVQFMDVIHYGKLRGICCPMAANSTDTWRFVQSVCMRTGDTPNSTIHAIPYHIGWGARSEAFATSTMTRDIFTASVTSTPSTDWEKPDDGEEGPNMAGLIIGGVSVVLFFTGVLVFLLNRRNNRIIPPPTTRPGDARTTGDASQQPTPGLVPRTTAELEADPPPIYSEDLREGEIPLSRLDPNGSTSTDNVDGSGDGTGNETGGNTSDGHILWRHLELPTPAYAPSSPGGSVSGGSEHGLLQDIPSQPAPAYTVLRD